MGSFLLLLPFSFFLNTLEEQNKPDLTIFETTQNTGMNLVRRQPFYIAAIVFIVLFIVIYPVYRYLFDLDGIGYMMVTKRLATGDFWGSVNGCWSPLHSWLMVPFYKLGVNEFTAFKVSNGVFGIAILFVCYRLLQKTTSCKPVQTAVLLTAIPMLLSYCIFQLAGDVLLLLLLLIYADVVSEPLLFEKTGKNVLCGIVGALAYYSKAYALPFFILHFSVIQYILWRQSTLPGKTRLLFRNLFTGIGTALLLIAPWVYILYQKYHFFTFSYAGKLNLTWALGPGTASTEFSIRAPFDNVSPGYWEDPYFATPHYTPFTSLHFFLKQIKVILHNILDSLEFLNAFTPFFIIIYLAVGAWLLKQRNSFFTVAWFTIGIFPLGYLLMHTEPRYLWIIAVLLLITGAFFLQQLIGWWQPGKRLSIICWCVFLLSFLPEPLHVMQLNAHADRSLFQLADKLKQQGITGKMAVKTEEFYLVQKLAFINKGQCYLFSMGNLTYDQLRTELRKAGVAYYFFFYQTPQDLDCFRNSTFYRESPLQMQVPDENLVIVQTQ